MARHPPACLLSYAAPGRSRLKSREAIELRQYAMADGDTRGSPLEPLYKTAPIAAIARSSSLRVLLLVDARFAMGAAASAR